MADFSFTTGSFKKDPRDFSFTTGGFAGQAAPKVAPIASHGDGIAPPVAPPVSPTPAPEKPARVRNFHQVAKTANAGADFSRAVQNIADNVYPGPPTENGFSLTKGDTGATYGYDPESNSFSKPLGFYTAAGQKLEGPENITGTVGRSMLTGAPISGTNFVSGATVAPTPNGIAHTPGATEKEVPLSMISNPKTNPLTNPWSGSPEQKATAETLDDMMRSYKTAVDPFNPFLRGRTRAALAEAATSGVNRSLESMVGGAAHGMNFMSTVRGQDTAADIASDKNAVDVQNINANLQIAKQNNALQSKILENTIKHQGVQEGFEAQRLGLDASRLNFDKSNSKTALEALKQENKSTPVFKDFLTASGGDVGKATEGMQDYSMATKGWSPVKEQKVGNFLNRSKVPRHYAPQGGVPTGTYGADGMPLYKLSNGQVVSGVR
jgi:hypothetical protein